MNIQFLTIHQKNIVKSVLVCLYIELIYAILTMEHLVVECLPPINKERRFERMNKREYNIKLLRYISLILLLLTLLVLVIKK